MSHSAALPVHYHPRKQGKEQGAMRELSPDQGFAEEKDKLPLEFSDLDIES